MYIEIKTADGKTAWMNDRYVRCVFEQDGEWAVRTDDRKVYIARKDNWGRSALPK